MGIKIGKEYRFEAAHHLPNHKGKCAQPHGHSYKLEVEVTSDDLIPVGPPDGGMVMDFADLDGAVKPLLEFLDHSDLNTSAPSRLGISETTAELLCVGIAMRLRDGLAHMPYSPAMVELSRVRLYETAKCYAEWTA